MVAVRAILLLILYSAGVSSALSGACVCQPAELSCDSALVLCLVYGISLAARACCDEGDVEKCLSPAKAAGCSEHFRQRAVSTTRRANVVSCATAVCSVQVVVV